MFKIDNYSDKPTFGRNSQEGGWSAGNYVTKPRQKSKKVEGVKRKTGEFCLAFTDDDHFLGEITGLLTNSAIVKKPNGEETIVNFRNIYDEKGKPWRKTTEGQKNTKNIFRDPQNFIEPHNKVKGR